MTIEEPPRIAVYDMIAAAKGRDNKYASSLYKRYLEEGKVPACEEVEPDGLAVSGESFNWVHTVSGDWRRGGCCRLQGLSLSKNLACRWVHWSRIDRL